MILADFLPAQPDLRWQRARQVGVTHAIVKLHPDLTGEAPPWDLDVLARVQRRFAAAGLTLIGLEGDQFDMTRIKEGLPGRAEDLARYRRMLANLGELGIPLLCYNFMARIGWFRTRSAVPERGGALVSAFSRREAERLPPAGALPIAEAQLWDHYRSFLEAVLPAAQRAGVRMALHPDDPPVSPLRGVARIFRSGAAVERALALSASPSHAVSFCQGSFAAMGEDLPALARRFAADGRIAFLHFRDVVDTGDGFRETFHDNGPTDMAAMIRLYGELGLAVPIRVDHVPTLAGEENAEPGYASLGRLFAIGYLKGLCEAQGVALI